MKGINPIIPPGSAFDGPRRGRSNMRMAVVAVVAVHLALFAVILGGHVACKKGPEEQAVKSEMEQVVPPKVASLPDSESLPDPVPSLPLIDPLTETQPALPPIETSTLPPIPEPVSPGGIVPPTQPLSEPDTTTEYQIASGDNFWTIGRKFGVSAQSIEQANPSVVPTRLQVGQKINIPTPVATSSIAPAVEPAINDGNVYTVKSGDTLGHIALRHKVKVAELKSANSLTSDLIRIGQKLKLPEKAITEPSTSLLLPPSPTFPKPVTPTSGSPPSLDPSGLPVGGAGSTLPPLGN